MWGFDQRQEGFVLRVTCVWVLANGAGSCPLKGSALSSSVFGSVCGLGVASQLVFLLVDRVVFLFR